MKAKPKTSGTTKEAIKAKKPASKKPAAKKPTGKKPSGKKPAGKRLPKVHAIQLEIQAAEMVHELAKEVAEILWARFQIECRRDALADAELVTHITDLSSLPSPHAEATPEQVVQAVTEALAEELPDAEVLWWVYEGVPKAEN